MDSLVLGGDVPSWHEDEQPLDSPVFSREVSPAAEWRRLAWPSSRGVTPEPLLLLTYYTPQVADPDFDYIPLHEKRPAVSEHDRNHAEADDWKSITSCEDLDLDVYTKVTARDGTTIYRKPPYQTDLGDEVGTIGSPTSVNIDGFRVCCNPGGGPPPLAEVHLVTEVSPDNKPHPRSWLGLPTTCLYEDASRAETLALRIEWTSEEGEPKSEYLKYTHFPLLFSTLHCPRRAVRQSRHRDRHLEPSGEQRDRSEQTRLRSGFWHTSSDARHLR
jgi:hypothetical protein